jgi:protein phosphatase
MAQPMESNPNDKRGRPGFWQRFRRWLRGSKQEASADPDLADTAPLSPDSLEHITVGKIRESLEAGSAQSIGLERESNEDSVFVMFGSSYGEDALPEFGLFCVADGAGGLGHGELASSIAIRTLTGKLMEDAVLAALDLEADLDRPGVEEIARNAFERANDAVREGANGGVTTLTAALVLNRKLTIAHVGDSRAYLVENGKPKLLTRDHSYSWRLVEIGQITPEEAMDHPKKNQLWNAVGQGSNLVIEVSTYPQPQGAQLLLCSDGLWGEVSEEELHSVLTLHQDPNETCEELVRAANAAGGPDNITALLVAFPGI